VFLGAQEGHHRSVAKAISWRVTGSMDTLILSYLITKNFVFASSIASAETITKIVLYYVHERAWTAIPWGRSSQMYLEGFRWQSWMTKSAKTAATLAFQLRHPSNPARLAAVGSFLFCFGIVLTPPQVQFRPSGFAESLTAEKADGSGSAITALLDGARTPAAVRDPSHETSDPAPEPAQWVRVTDAAPQLLKAEPQIEGPRRSLVDHDQAKEVQQRLIQLGYLSVSATGVWGQLSRKALKAFKSDHDLPADEIWDEATEHSLFGGSEEKAEPFVGIWGVDPSACSLRPSRNGFLPAVIDVQGARAGETSCMFESRKRTTRGWNVVANCSNAQDRWTANIHLMVNGDQLIWTSERGSQSYLRCQPGLGVARAF
jgi:uncharacterized membrane protein